MKVKIQKLLPRYWPIIIIFLVWSIFAWPFLSKGLVPFPSDYLVSFFSPWQYLYKLPVKNAAMPDVLAQLYPWRHLVVESFKNGQLPLWNPYLFSGTPLLANFQSAAFSPLNVLFLFLPFSNAWSWLILLQPLLASLFMYLFLRELKISHWGAVGGALSFFLCGFIVVWMTYGTLSLVVVWLPLLLWAIEKTFQKVTPFALSIVSISLAFSLFSGHFQTSLYIGLSGLLYALFKFWMTKKAKTLLLIVSFLLIGILVALPQLSPSIELYSHSVRGLSFTGTETIPWYYLITLLAPDFFGNPVTYNDWFGHYAEWAGFIGVLPLILSVFSIHRIRGRREILFFFLLGISALLFTLRSPLADMVIQLKIPVVSTSAASRLIVIFSFSFAVLSGFGLDEIKKNWDKKENLKRIIFPLLGIGFIFLALWLVILFLHILPMDKLAIAKRNFVLPTLIFILSSFFIMSGFFLKSKFRIVILAGILALLSFDSLRFAGKWMPFKEEKYLYPRLPVINFLQKEVGINRIYGNFGNELVLYFHLQSPQGYDPLYLKRYKELISTGEDAKIGNLFSDRSTVLLPKNGQYTPRLLSLLGVKYILYAKDDGWRSWSFPFWKNLDQYKLVYDDPKFQVLENKNALPRAFLVGDYEVINENQKIIDRLLDKSFNLSERITLEEKPLEKITFGKGAAFVKNYTSGKIEIDVDHAVPQMLFISDSFYPGWQAKIDGKSTKIYRADYAFRAVFVPEGRHLVKFTYEPSNLKTSIIISSFTVLFLLFINMRAVLKRLKK